MWPGGYPAGVHPAPESSRQACRAAFARAKFIGIMPGNNYCLLILQCGAFTCTIILFRWYEEILGNRESYQRNGKVWKKAMNVCRFVAVCCLYRLFGMLQIEAFNCRLTLRLLEGLLDTLFPNRNLRDTCRRLRTDLSSSLTQPL